MRYIFIFYRIVLAVALGGTIIMVHAQVLKIGHRGAMAYEVENSAASFEKAIELGVDMVECDVRRCKSGELIIFHDRKVDRITDGSGALEDLTLKEVRLLRLKNGQSILTLLEFLDLINKRVMVNLEVKEAGIAHDIASIIYKYITKYGWSADQFFITSFNHQELCACQQECKKIFNTDETIIKTGALITGIPITYAQFGTDSHADVVVVDKEFISQEFIDDAHARNLLVYVYTVNHPDDIAYIQSLRVDGIISNNPDKI